MDHEEITGQIIGCAMKVHSVLGPGFLKSVYQNALTLELQKLSLKVECKFPIEVHYDGVRVGIFEADMFVVDCIILEIKAIRALAMPQEVQLVNYLTATGVEVGLLLNFGAAKLEFKRKHRAYKPKHE